MVLALAGAMTGCDENSWNDHLDGFKEAIDAPITNEQTIDYTLTDADYAAIASNSSNKAMAGDALKSALAAVGTRHAFSPEIPASQYVPAFLGSTSFPYFTLTQGSSVKLTYNVAGETDPILAKAADAVAYTVSEENYMNEVWESDDNYIKGFAPSKPASKLLPGILAANIENPAEGQFAMVTYYEADQNPVFGNVGGDDKPAFEMSSVIGSCKKGDVVSANAVVTGICAQGYIVTDKTGSILVYVGKSYDLSSMSIGDEVAITGEIGSYNKGLQFTGSGDAFSVEIVGHENYTYPAPKVMTGADFQEALNRTDDELAQYVQVTGKVKISGNYVNFEVEGSGDANPSLYQATDAQKAACVDGEEVTFCGYFIALAKKNCNIVLTSVNGKAANKAGMQKAPAAEVPTNKQFALYQYTGGKWAAASSFYVVEPADYRSMGQKYDNLEAPAEYLGKFLGVKFPYAAEGDTQNIAYYYYASSKTTLCCDQYIFKNGAWVLNQFITEETSQFVYSPNGWMYNPNVTITLPAGKNQETSMTYYQACGDWVYENICVPLGDTSIKSGKYYVTSYGNNEYYSGTSAYQGNVDLRPSAARDQYAAGYEGMSDDEIVALEKQRFMNEVMPGALSTLHADAKPIEGLEVLYTVNFSVYDGATTAYTAVFKVVGPGKFEPVSCTWDEPAE